MSIHPKILITGATDGIGRLAALKLAQGGAHLILTARNGPKAEQTRLAIAAIAPSARVDIYFVDFSDLATVAAVGRSIAMQHPRIDVLINNAGLHAFEQRTTKDGYAEMIAVNYFAPWLLTNVLRETLIHSSPARIITVASQASRQSGGLNLDRDLLDTAPFTALGSSKVYGRSKLLDIMFSLELARQLEDTQVSVNCMCPGFNVTSLGRELGFSRVLSKALNALGIGAPSRGADAIVNLATGTRFAGQTGLYLTGKGQSQTTPVSPADNETARRQLWDMTDMILSRFQ